MTAHLTPTLGRRRLDGLGPEHLATLYAAKLAEGLSPSSIRYLHAVIRRGLAIAVRWDLVARNVATLVDPPEAHHVEIEPLTPSEAHAFLTAARSSPMEARWVVGLSLGLRQSEALGLQWEDVDLDRGVLRVRRQLLRRRAKGESLLFGPLKSRRSRRVLSVPALLVDLLREHKTRQEAARRRAGSRWADERVVFATSLGRPIEHRNDTWAFKALCRRAGLRAVRLHDLRHTAASLLLAQGQHPRVVMEVLGHSQISLTMNTYSHVMPSLLRDAADAMTEALWNEDESA